MGRLLVQLGSGFAYTEIPLEALEDTSKLVKYDVLFLTCGTYSAHSINVLFLVLVIGPESGSEKGMRMSSIASARRWATTSVAEERFMHRTGGKLFIHDCFPELFDGEDIVTGAAQTVLAHVVDDGLREYLGTSKVEIRFDLAGWYPARFASDKATFYLRGDYRPKTGGERMDSTAACQGSVRARYYHIYIISQ